MWRGLLCSALCGGGGSTLLCVVGSALLCVVGSALLCVVGSALLCVAGSALLCVVVVGGGGLLCSVWWGLLCSVWWGLLCSVFAGSFAIKPNCSKTSTKSNHKQHNRELKRLRKQKLRTQRALRVAQRGCRCVEDQRRLGLEYRQLVWKCHTALIKKSNKSASWVNIYTYKVWQKCIFVCSINIQYIGWQV